jgi:hypothetical protein
MGAAMTPETAADIHSIAFSLKMLAAILMFIAGILLTSGGRK